MTLTLKTAMIFTLGLTCLAAAKAQVPFKGTLHGPETDLFQGNPPTQILVDGDVTGVATHSDGSR